MKVKMKRIMGLFLALAVSIGCLSLNSIASYADDGVEINEYNFPAKGFRDYVKRFDTTPDNKLSQTELDGVREISIPNQLLPSLKGIEYFKNLETLDCSYDSLPSLDVSHNTKLKYLQCGSNYLTSLDLSNNINLNSLDCTNNNLKSLVLSNSTNLDYLNCNDNQLTSLDVSKSTHLTRLYCDRQQYNITVIKGIRKFKYTDFPEGFDKDKATSLHGATLGGDGLIVASDNTTQVTYKYKVGDRNNHEMSVTLNVSYVEFKPTSMTVEHQPTKLSYTDGEKLNLDGLTVKLSDGHVTKVVPLADFGKYKITMEPDNGTELKLDNNEKPVTLKRGNLTATTDALQVKQRVFDPTRVTSRTITHQPKLSYTEGERLDLTGLVVTLTDYQGLRKEVPFAQFERYGINAYPADKTFLKVADHNGKPVKLVIYRPGMRIQSWSAQAGVLMVKPRVFDSTHVNSMSVTAQPSKLSYTEDDKLDLTGLEVTLEDANHVKKVMTPAEFEANGIKATPENGAKLALTDGNPVKLTRGNLTATTSALKVKAKESIPTHVGGGSTSTSTSGSGSAGGSAGGFSAGMNYYAPTTVDKGELNIQIDSAESDSKPGYAGDGAGAAVKQAADRLGDALA